jgi:thiamine biosynthesis lipoprotein
MEPGEVNGDQMELRGEAQGTTFTIKYVDSLHRDLSAPVDSLLQVVDRSLSLWDGSSTVTLFNAAPDTFVSSDVHFRTVLSLSQGLWQRTQRAFDPTVLPLVRAWGLGKEGRAELDTAGLNELRAVVGMDRIRIEESWRSSRSDPPTVTYHKARPDVQFDPNGIAQGYTVDLIAFMLQAHGITDHMVEVGGEVRCSGVNNEGGPWRMQIDKPVEGHVQQTVVPLQGRSLATSGNYRKFIQLGGKRYGHTIDPRTGRPAMNALLSASVIADDCATADALGTALMVMGPEEAQAWLGLHPNVDAYLIVDDGRGGYLVWNTPDWPTFSDPNGP